MSTVLLPNARGIASIPLSSIDHLPEIGEVVSVGCLSPDGDPIGNGHAVHTVEASPFKDRPDLGWKHIRVHIAFAQDPRMDTWRDYRITEVPK